MKLKEKKENIEQFGKTLKKNIYDISLVLLDSINRSQPEIMPIMNLVALLSHDAITKNLLQAICELFSLNVDKCLTTG